MKNKLFFPAAVIGAQWGDEGKGKIVDLIADKADVVVRFNGGNNAGHTIIYNGEVCKLHVLPSGIFQRKKTMIAQGAVFDPEVLLTELEWCNKHNLPLDLLIDYRVNLVMPYHRLQDSANEAWKGKKATGSLHLGIGFCYEDRNNRNGVRCEDLLYPKILREKLEMYLPLKKAIIEKAYKVKFPLELEEIYKRYLYFAKILKPYLGDVSTQLGKTIHSSKILFEGANGTMLDGVFGTYPYTVACHTTAPSLYASSGIYQVPTYVLGITKAYTTRVGGGPFPTEQINEYGEAIQRVGQEVGATSGRKRRCGWLDLPVLRFAHRINHFSSLAVTKLDVLSQFKEIPVCVGYKLGTKVLTEYPATSHDFYRVKPVYETLPGWHEDISTVSSYNKLPQKAKGYIEFIEQQTGIQVSLVSVGPERERTITK